MAGIDRWRTTVTASLSVVLSIVIGVAIALLATDLSGWLTQAARGLVHRAAERLPQDERWREEEWLSELAEFEDRPLTSSAVAVRIAHNARSVRRELRDAVAQQESLSDAPPNRAPHVTGLTSSLSKVVTLTWHVIKWLVETLELMFDVGSMRLLSVTAVGFLIGSCVGIVSAAWRGVVPSLGTLLYLAFGLASGRVCMAFGRFKRSHFGGAY